MTELNEQIKEALEDWRAALRRAASCSYILPMWRSWQYEEAREEQNQAWEAYERVVRQEPDPQRRRTLLRLSYIPNYELEAELFPKGERG